MQATYVQGSILRHILVMSGSGAVGLAALFVVDLADMYFLSLLGDTNITAAVGYAASILFFTLSMNIGLAIGCGALIAKAAGGNDKTTARRQVAHIFIAIFGVAFISAVLVLFNSHHILTWLGAHDEALDFAQAYLNIVICSTPIMGIAMACSAVMRALGAAKQAMGLTLIGAAINAILDPIFIFVLDLNIIGAAIASVCSHIAMGVYGIWIVVKQFNLIGRLQKSLFIQDLRIYLSVAFPAVLTNLATPISIAYVTAVMADFGNDAVSGNAIVARIQQVAFAGLFALSGAVGGIAAQNWGAQHYDRVKSVLDQSLAIIFVYCLVICGGLCLMTGFLVETFQAHGQEADLIRWFCWGLSAVYLFNGITFVTNALFNNLGVAHYATQFNFSKATLGTIPFVYFGAQIAGPYGIYWGFLVGASIVAAIGLWINYWHIRRLPQFRQEERAI